MSTRVFLIGSKVIPKLTFGSHISRVPKAKLDVAISRCIWGRRPKWRSKWLVQAVFGKPHRTDPRTASAFHTIFEVIRSCHSDPALFPKLLATHRAHQSLPHSLASRFEHACSFLNIQVNDDLCLSFCNSQPISVKDLTPQDVRRILQAIARDACYRLASSTPRKDFVKTVQVFDHAMTTSFFRSAKVCDNDDISNHQRLESVLVVALPTTGWLPQAGVTRLPAESVGGKRIHDASGAPMLLHP